METPFFLLLYHQKFDFTRKSTGDYDRRILNYKFNGIYLTINYTENTKHKLKSLALCRVYQKPDKRGCQGQRAKRALTFT